MIQEYKVVKCSDKWKKTFKNIFKKKNYFYFQKSREKIVYIN